MSGALGRQQQLCSVALPVTPELGMAQRFGDNAQHDVMCSQGQTRAASVAGASHSAQRPSAAAGMGDGATLRPMPLAETHPSAPASASLKTVVWAKMRGYPHWPVRSQPAR